jgi:hypothetical protein
MFSTITKTLLTADEFAQCPDPIAGSKQELVRGEVITSPTPTFLHGFVKGNVCFVLQSHARQS